jgi:hypothetical protein
MPPHQAQLEVTLAISCGIAITPRASTTPIKSTMSGIITMSKIKTMLGKVNLFNKNKVTKNIHRSYL